MATRLSVERALQLILEEREASDDDVEEEISESDSDFEEEDEVEHQLVPKPQIIKRQRVPRTPAIMRRIQEENAGAPSTRPTEPPSAEPEVSV